MPRLEDVRCRAEATDVGVLRRLLPSLGVLRLKVQGQGTIAASPSGLQSFPKFCCILIGLGLREPPTPQPLCVRKVAEACSPEACALPIVSIVVPFLV